MQTIRISKTADRQCKCTVATKVTPEELEILNAMAEVSGLSRYNLIRSIIRATISKVKGT